MAQGMGLTMKHLSQLLPSMYIRIFLLRGEPEAGAVNIKNEHGYCGLKRRPLATVAAQGGTFE